MFQLTARVAWHDSRWNGSVCRQLSCNFASKVSTLLRLWRTGLRVNDVGHNPTAPKVEREVGDGPQGGVHHHDDPVPTQDRNRVSELSKNPAPRKP